jgi:hypothetical protein
MQTAILDLSESRIARKPAEIYPYCDNFQSLQFFFMMVKHYSREDVNDIDFDAIIPNPITFGVFYRHTMNQWELSISPRLYPTVGVRMDMDDILKIFRILGIHIISKLDISSTILRKTILPIEICDIISDYMQS